jgi:hypothetical protein
MRKKFRKKEKEIEENVVKSESKSFCEKKNIEKSKRCDVKNKSFYFIGQYSKVGIMEYKVHHERNI